MAVMVARQANVLNALKMVKIANFMLCIFNHNKKKFTVDSKFKFNWASCVFTCYLGQLHPQGIFGKRRFWSPHWGEAAREASDIAQHPAVADSPRQQEWPGAEASEPEAEQLCPWGRRRETLSGFARGLEMSPSATSQTTDSRRETKVHNKSTHTLSVGRHT